MAAASACADMQPSKASGAENTGAFERVTSTREVFEFSVVRGASSVGIYNRRGRPSLGPTDHCNRLTDLLDLKVSVRVAGFSALAAASQQPKAACVAFQARQTSQTSV